MKQKMSKKKRRAHRIWVVITIVGVLAMLAFTLAPMLMYY